MRNLAREKAVETTLRPAAFVWLREKAERLIKKDKIAINFILSVMHSMKIC